jgi:hypothetical protein
MTEEEGELQKVSKIMWELQGCSLIFPRGPDGEVLLGYGCQADQVVSEGHFTNMISAASPSESSLGLSSGSSSYKSEGEKAANRRNSDTSLGSHAPRNAGDCSSRPTRYDYPEKRLAMASAEHLNNRRINSLHMAYGTEHRAHSPDQPGCPELDSKRIMNLEFAIPEEALGLLDKFNADYEATHVTDSENVDG